MAVTGLILYLFLIGHMVGNLQIFLGPEALNSYAKHLVELPALLWPARIFLLLILLTHVLTSLSLAVENRLARPIAYVHQSTVTATPASRNMVLSGLAILLFIIYHLLHFTFRLTNPQISSLTDSQGRHDVYSMVVFSFQQTPIAIAYVLSMLVFCIHLSHGGLSFLQTLGLCDDKKRSLFVGVSHLVATAIFVGNSLIVIACLTGWLKPLAGSV